jgi:hypothetical protein
MVHTSLSIQAPLKTCYVTHEEIALRHGGITPILSTDQSVPILVINHQPSIFSESQLVTKDSTPPLTYNTHEGFVVRSNVGFATPSKSATYPTVRNAPMATPPPSSLRGKTWGLQEQHAPGEFEHSKFAYSCL